MPVLWNTLRIMTITCFVCSCIYVCIGNVCKILCVSGTISKVSCWFCKVSSCFYNLILQCEFLIFKSHIFSTACPDPEYNSLPLQWCEQITGPSVVQKNASIPQYDGALALPTSDPWEQWYPRTKLAIFWCHAKPIDRDGAEIHHVC